jgi:hypothetical protein
MPCTAGGAPVTIERLFGFVKLGMTAAPSRLAPRADAAARKGMAPARKACAR